MVNQDTYGYSAGELMDPVRGQKWIKYRGRYGSSEESLMALRVVRGHLWTTWALMDTIRGRLWIQYGVNKWIQYGGTMDPVRGNLWIYL